MDKNTAIIITSISAPNAVMKSFAEGSKQHGAEFIVIGDTKTPADFQLDGCNYYSVEQQRALPFAFAKACPERHYSRKNIGYLIAAKNGAEQIIESDDDNYPRENFWNNRSRKQQAYDISNEGWLNVYAHYSKGYIWPRGYPLEQLHKVVMPLESFDVKELDCPIQQGLADENPDIDAVFRLTQALPHSFDYKHKIGLGNKTWCPYNSQNTTHYKEAFPLLYLPSYCSFRMTDIWRSFVAQRIAWENNWHILFEEATVWQERNEHNLLRDFEDEIPGYLNNAKIATTLEKLELKKGTAHLGDNLITCYKALIDINVIGAQEMPLLEAWISDLG